MEWQGRHWITRDSSWVSIALAEQRVITSASSSIYRTSAVTGHTRGQRRTHQV
jgi:hypothetical protein